MSVALVTGATGGVGRAIVERLIRHKNYYVIGISRSRESLDELKRKYRDNFIDVLLDIRNAVAIEELIPKVHGRITVDLLINCAANYTRGPFVESSIEDIDSIIDTNIKGTMYITRAVLPMMTQGGLIVNIGSVAGTHAIENESIYCASKYALEGWSDALGRELRSRQIAVTLIAPGGIDTPLWNDKNPYPGEPGLLLGPHDIAAMVMYVLAQPLNVVMKKIVMFPTNEWH